MNEIDLEDYLVLRDLDEPLSVETFEAAADGSVDALETLHDEGVSIRWLKSEIRTRPDGDVVGTVCHYRAEDRAAIHEHADRAGLPVTRIDIHAHTMANE